MPLVAIVGAGPGLGAAVAHRFGSAGFAVALIARNLLYGPAAFAVAACAGLAACTSEEPAAEPSTAPPTTPSTNPTPAPTETSEAASDDDIDGTSIRIGEMDGDLSPAGLEQGSLGHDHARKLMARVLVTGASTGLGLLTVRSLVEQGHEVVLHARTAERIEEANLLGQLVGALYGDLADLDSVRRIADEATGLTPVDAVVHNAGVIDGPDLIAVNVVAPYVLSALMEHPARTIVLSSSMHCGGSPHHVTDAIAGRREASYSDTKLWATALFLGVARRWPGVLVHAVDPGWVPTRMGGPSASDNLTQGHRTQEWLAVAPEDDIDPQTGGYWHHHQALRPHPAALDAPFQEEVIAALEARTGIALQS